MNDRDYQRLLDLAECKLEKGVTREEAFSNWEDRWALEAPNTVFTTLPMMVRLTVPLRDFSVFNIISLFGMV